MRRGLQNKAEAWRRKVAAIRAGEITMESHREKSRSKLDHTPCVVEFSGSSISK